MGLLDFTKPIKCTFQQGVTDPARKAAAELDAQKWKAKRVSDPSGRHGNDHIEIRKTFQCIGHSNVFIVVAKDGWNLGVFEKRDPDRWGRSTRGKNVRIAMNAAAMLSFEELSEMNAVIAEAKAILG